MKTSRWKVWVDCGSGEKATKVVSKVCGLAFDAESTLMPRPCPKGGFVAEWEREHQGRWNDVVVEVIAIGQRMASGWVLTGDVHSDPEGLASKTAGVRFHVAGVTMITWAVIGTA